jgi:hypothetical protein
MPTTPMGRSSRAATLLLSAMLLALPMTAGLSALPVTAAQAAETLPASFETPEAAAQALLSALAADDHAAIIKVLGSKYEDELFIDEASREQAAYQGIVSSAKDVLQLRADAPDLRVMVIGKQAWPMPIPIKQEAGHWSFDTDSGIDEIITRRIGADELAAIDLAHAYVNAQMVYASEDHDGDEVLEYAQRLVSTPGKTDGLYWDAKDGQVESPFGPYVAELPAYVKDHKPGEPYMGYYFHILTAQGSHAPGGRYNYIINGNMIAGFALIAVPAEYGDSGVMTFIVNHQGKIYQKDLGKNTEKLAAAIHEYDPDSSWKLVTDTDTSDAQSSDTGGE